MLRHAARRTARRALSSAAAAAPTTTMTTSGSRTGHLVARLPASRSPLRPGSIPLWHRPSLPPSRAPRRELSSSAAAVDDFDDRRRRPPADDAVAFDRRLSSEIRRLSHVRNVGILAHVDAGKTTVTERMLALAGIVRRVGSVDDGSTVTDYLPAERERGITIQSAAISFPWGWHNHRTGDDFEPNDDVRIHLIDTPGHVDFSVEVNRSVAVLDGAVLVVDAVAGVQAQTETVWRAITRPSMNNHAEDALTTALATASTTTTTTTTTVASGGKDHAHEPLPCLALVNKMDREGRHFGRALESLRSKLPGANPIAIQIPLFRVDDGDGPPEGEEYGDPADPTRFLKGLVAVPVEETSTSAGSAAAATVAADGGRFAGVVDLVHMRAVVWPDPPTLDGASNVESCVPDVTNLPWRRRDDDDGSDLDDANDDVAEGCPITAVAREARADLVARLADVDESIEEYFLTEEEPSNAELRAALRRGTLSRKVLPVLAGAALRGKGVEPLLDAVADLLPSPLDRMPPALMRQDHKSWGGKGDAQWRGSGKSKKKGSDGNDENNMLAPLKDRIKLGHPLHPDLLALAFKVVHMKGRGGSGDGRVVFARVYSGKLRDRDAVKVVTPKVPGEAPEKPRTEKIGGMLELAGGRFDNLEDGICESGDVCALIGLKSVVTGDTILLHSNGGGNNGSSSSSDDRKKKRGKKKGGARAGDVCLAGVASPRPVLTVRVEAESAEQQARLSDALNLLAIEDPSLRVEETESATLLSGLGELHVEVTLDRLRREFGLVVSTGSPAVAYRETVTDAIETEGGGLFEYDRTIGGTRLQAAVRIALEPLEDGPSSCALLSDPVVTLGPRAKRFLGFDPSTTEEDMSLQSDAVRALLSGCRGSLRRGGLGSYAMANVRCRVVDVDAEGGLASVTALPGSLRAASAQAIAATLAEHRGKCAVLEPTMSVEVTVPADMVGAVLSDLTGRRGTVGDVAMGDGNGGGGEGHDPSHAKALVRGDVPLAEILGYANSLRSLTGGEGAFTAEYKGHSACDVSAMT